MKFAADFHIHSKFSRATAKNLDFENIYTSAQIKGITVLGTGDFTHPGWFSEIKEKLVPSGEGIFKLKDHVARPLDKTVPSICRRPVHFILVSEISNIYKKDGKTRKNHNLVFFPNIETAEKFNSKLDKIGNIKSDGRPILGLDSRDLLEILLETSDSAYLVPAHIWTPWFSLLGSKSGFDSVEECFEDLTPHIFAVETGLSSDPMMNWRVSGLDNLTLISNSDAHSPSKLGREANLFDMEPSFGGIRSAIMKGDKKRFLGTIEFYPEEGKYHLDGHRKCQVRLQPKDTIEKEGFCPVCKKPVTLGVLHRIEELSDRKEGIRPKRSHPFTRLIPLVEVLSELLSVGPTSKRVATAYRALIDKLGSELNILQKLPLETLKRAGIPYLEEAILRVRQNKICILPGYDGEFGTVRIFNSEERERNKRQRILFKTKISEKKPIKKRDEIVSKNREEPLKKQTSRFTERKKKGKLKNKIFFNALNSEQRRIVFNDNKPMVVVAGPGTGKTHTLTCRIAHLIKERGVSPEKVLSITFTNKASREMKERLRLLLKGEGSFPLVTTFHGFCYGVLSEIEKEAGHPRQNSIVDDFDRKRVLSEAIKIVNKKECRSNVKSETILNLIVSAKQHIQGPDENPAELVWGHKNKAVLHIYKTYQNILTIEGLLDYEDLIVNMVALLQKDPVTQKKYQQKYTHIFVDEFQDINYGQYQLIRALSPSGVENHHLCVIGDPDQSIYGFRGSDIRYFKKLITDYPNVVVHYLSQNYRSTQTILDASHQVIKNHSKDALKTQVYSEKDGKRRIQIIQCGSGKAEAVTVGKTIEEMIGGTGYFSIDAGRVVDHNTTTAKSFSDFAVLYRTAGQGRLAAEMIEGFGIPCQRVSKERVYHKKGAAELISMLKIVCGVGSFIDLERSAGLITPGVGKSTIALFKQWSWQNKLNVKNAMDQALRVPIQTMSLPQQRKLGNLIKKRSEMDHAMSRMMVEEKIHFLLDQKPLLSIIEKNPESDEAVRFCISTSQAFEKNTHAFLNTIALQVDTDIYDVRAEKVSLMTMHAAKGLEFPVVFIIGCERGFLPYEKALGDALSLEEERRLFYVAMTRAKEELYFLWAEKRTIFGKTSTREVSPFVLDIKETLLSRSRPQKKGKVAKEHYKQLGLF